MPVLFLEKHFKFKNKKKLRKIKTKITSLEKWTNRPTYIESKTIRDRLQSTEEKKSGDSICLTYWIRESQ